MKGALLMLVLVGLWQLSHAGAADHRIRVSGAVTPALRDAVYAALNQLPDTDLIDDVYISPGGGVGMALGPGNCGEAWTTARRIVISNDPVCHLSEHLTYYIAHEIGHMRQAADGWPNRDSCPLVQVQPLSYGGYCWQADERDATAYGHRYGN